MQELNLPFFEFNIKQEATHVSIFDVFRKKYVVLTPEEWVRQNFLQYLLQHKNYPISLIALEASLKYNKLKKRADILIYNKQGQPHMMIECKAPTIKISQDTFDQVARYNMIFKVKYLVVTNGMEHFCCEMNYSENTYLYLKTIPLYE
jgi:hypothetical protein